MPCTADQVEYRTQRETKKVGNERATRDGVLDYRTERALHKLVNKDQAIKSIDGCLSSGKEANVYYATPPDDDGASPLGTASSAASESESGASGDALEGSKELAVASNCREKKKLAVKVYATTINSFKTRHIYMQGWRNTDRVRQGRRMVEQWATNEYKRLQRLRDAGVPCPQPIAHRENVVVVSLLGSESGEAFPRLLNAQVDSEDVWADLYLQLLCIVRRMYKVGRLVHGDLSEYNILYNEGALYIIDVSQSLEHSHPQSINMLRRDMANMTMFFRKKKVTTLDGPSAFEFITSDAAPLEMEAMEPALKEMLPKAGHGSRRNQGEKAGDGTESREDDDITSEGSCADESKVQAAARIEAEIQESIFQHKFIARTLDEAYDLTMEGQEVELAAVKMLLAENGRDGYEKEEDGDSDGGDGDEEGLGEGQSSLKTDGSQTESDQTSRDPRRPRGKKNIPKDEKQEHKALVKVQNRERRQEKMPKKEKKALVAKTRRSRRK